MSSNHVRCIVAMFPLASRHFCTIVATFSIQSKDQAFLSSLDGIIDSAVEGGTHPEFSAVGLKKDMMHVISLSLQFFL